MNNAPNEYSQEFVVHFDIPDHRLTIDEFYQTAKTVQIITDSFNQFLFDGKPLVGMYVKAPEKGGVIETLELVLVQHPLISVVVTPVGVLFLDGIIKGLVGKNISEMGQTFSIGTQKIIQDMVNDTANDIQRLKIDVPVGLELLKGSVEVFLQRDSNEIKKIEGSEKISLDASVAKSKFYTMCAKSGKIKGLGFSRKHEFPIKQSDFIKHIIAEPIQTDDIQRRYELHEVTIIAPVNVEDSQVQWKTKDKNTGKRISFFMTDGNFRNEFFGGLYPLKETKKDDEMLVYVEYTTTTHPNGKKYEKRQAIKVYRFNDRNLAEVPESIKLNTPYLNANPNQGELFDITKF